MRSVTRSPQPGFFNGIRTAYTNWNELTVDDHSRIRRAVEREFEVERGTFGYVCTYCEREIEPLNQWTIDHFRPRDRFPSLWLDWINLVYSCQRCNESKGNKWPGLDQFGTQDTQTHQWLSAWYPRYTPVSEYVNPNEATGQRPARAFFDFDVETGEIKPAEQLGDEDWAKSLRTIRDIDLNGDESGLGLNDDNHLWNQRTDYLDTLLEEIEKLRNPDMQDFLIRQSMNPGQPFACFVAAYFQA